MTGPPSFTLHSYPWYLANWRGSETRIELNLEERGLYRELLDFHYSQGSLPDDDRKLLAIVGCTEKEFNRAWPAVRPHFVARDGRLEHPKVLQVLETLEGYREQRRQAGKLSGERRRERSFNERSTSAQRALNSRSNEKATSRSNEKATAQVEPYTYTNTNTKTSTEVPTNDRSTGVPELAARLYVSHPNKAGKILSEQALTSKLADAVDPRALASRIETAHAAWLPHWLRDGGRFAPRLDRWIRDDGYMDNPPESGVDDDEPLKTIDDFRREELGRG